MSAKFSFCIITDGKEPFKLLAEMVSIRNQSTLASKEIIVVGKMHPTFMAQWETFIGKYRFIEAAEAADLGRLGVMRNTACSAAIGHWLIVCDDDILFAPDFLLGIVRRGEFDVAASHIINPDGSRFWDWATYGGPRGHHLLSYDILEDPFTYVTGGLMTMRRKVFEDVQWCEKMGFYQYEDVDFSMRIHLAGYHIIYNHLSTAMHMDEGYTSLGLDDVTKLSWQDRKALNVISPA
jgi:hypothetical protein